ncbi:STAS domain-containing protein [Chitinophaga sp. GCM10012297]|uniref:STAS domain-containing protein n=1 Tax=Chitinophaga chungangae TaxID=2821488 RepID=A0ABS3YK43_9BACT|nr:STAS domain-containing protein [Chitinophaga chungangae]MBO9155029.1 STAS domain-containing protein [Chitinophaga chungangae]
MQFKIDTKEKIVLLRLEEETLDAKMSDTFVSSLASLDELEQKNLILDLHSLQSADDAGLKAIFTVYARQYDRGLSAAVTGLNSTLTQKLSAAYPEILNIVPTESEAIDMVMMEDLERELNLDDE